MRRDVRRWDRTLHDPYEPSHGPACATAGTHTDAPEECVGAFFHRPAVGGPVPKSRSRHPPAAAGCRSPRPARHGTGGGYGRQATGVATGFIRRVPTRVPTAVGGFSARPMAGACRRVPGTGDRLGAVLCSKVRLLPGIAHNFQVLTIRTCILTSAQSVIY